MSDEIQIVSRFQTMVHIFDLSMDAQPDKELRVRLIQEEAEELIEAVKARDVIETIDAVCDLLYVTYGAAHVLKAGVLAVQDDRMENIPIRSREPNWTRLVAEVTDLDGFNHSVSSVVQAIRTGTKERLHLELKLLTEGLWECGAEGIGVDLKPFFTEVHRTNMNKLQGPKRADGKQLKPEGWKPPRIKALYERWVKGQNPHCHVLAPFHAKKDQEHGYDIAFRIEHPDGGYHCQQCGGLFVEWELSYSEDIKRGKTEMPKFYPLSVDYKYGDSK